MDLTLTIRLIKNCLKENFGVSNKIKTTLSNVVKMVINKHPEASADDIKSAMADMEGWSTAPFGMSEQIEITPTFFN